jgi:hypothetical protein
MISPCPRCGATRTDSVRHGVMYRLVWIFGYRLQQCSRCRLPRFIRRPHDVFPDSLQLREEAAAGPHFVEERRAQKMVKGNSALKENQVIGAGSSNRGWGRCPACRTTRYHRSRRTILERILLRPRMAHCEKCGSRFPYPKHVEESPGSFQWGEEAADVPHFAEGRTTSKIPEENFEPRVTTQVADADSSIRRWGRCPVCGSMAYRRSRRTTLERILLRPRMARCRKCRKRFPYPKG